MLYTMTIEKKGLFWRNTKKKYKNIKGHFMLNDLPGFLCIRNNKELDVLVNMGHVVSIELSQEFFIMKAKKVKEEAQGVNVELKTEVDV